MRLSYLKTHGAPEDAHAILSLLDELRDALWNAYGPEIISYEQQRYAEKTRKDNVERGEHQLTLFDPEKDDIMPF